MSCEYDWEQTDKAMAAELEAAGLPKHEIEEWSPERKADYEREAWAMDYSYALETIYAIVFADRARFCPVCDAEVGQVEWEAGDYSVGIYPCWENACPEHGEFVVWADGIKELV